MAQPCPLPAAFESAAPAGWSRRFFSHSVSVLMLRSHNRQHRRALQSPDLQTTVTFPAHLRSRDLSQFFFRLTRHAGHVGQGHQKKQLDLRRQRRPMPECEQDFLLE
jgi:hypothetical protein